MPNTFKNTPTATTDDAYVAARAGFKIRVYSVVASNGATASGVTFNSKGSGAGTAIFPLMSYGAQGGAILNYNPQGWFDTARGEGLTVTTAAGGSAVGISVSYGYIGL